MAWTEIGQGVSARLGTHVDTVSATLARGATESVVARLWAGDHRLWDPAPAEIANRLGWLRCADHAPGVIAAIDELRRGVGDDHLSQVLLVGMGGSSLAPEMFARVFRAGNEARQALTVLDTTHPQQVRTALDAHDPARTLVLASTKSGTTVETLSLMKAAYAWLAEAVGPSRALTQMMVITDPGTPLDTLARRQGFRAVVAGDPEIGGRYSALSPFGLVPAALAGIDLERLMASANRMTDQCKEGRNGAPTAVGQAPNPGLWLGAVLGALAEAGRDQVQLVLSPRIQALGGWIEQLIAESTGKAGKGILPIVGGIDSAIAPRATWDQHLVVHVRLGDDLAGDRIVSAFPRDVPLVRIHLDDPYDLGAEIFRWEFAAAVACWRLGVNAFDQPDVEAAKVRARQNLDRFAATGQTPALAADLVFGPVGVVTGPERRQTAVEAAGWLDLLAEYRERAGRHSYLAIQAYLPYEADVEAALLRLQHAVRSRLDWTTTIGYGPRFLHSTGQLHKGDAGHGVFLQFAAPSRCDVDIPDALGSDSSAVSFGTLIAAQSLGDREALLDAGRQVLRVELGPDMTAGLNYLGDVVEGR